ncbi:hypothetical protein BOC44_21655 (plasmid) [Burkholderia pseudomallei]|nr:hypothetical protein BOC44_21655 [Burkholderia pseudomallei]
MRQVSPNPDPQDSGVAGIYAVIFGVDDRQFPDAKRASMALDIFHAHQGIERLDDFEIEVIDEDGWVVEQDPDHVDYSASDDGEVEKISGKPVPEDDLTRQRHLPANQGGALNDNWPAGATVKLESRTIYGTKVGHIQWAYRDETGQLMSLQSRMPLDTLRYSVIEERTSSESRLFEGEWSHLFGPGRAETRCRIVVDVASDKLVAAQAFDGVKWFDLSRTEREDLADSLFNANEISRAPEQAGLSAVGSLPSWVPSGMLPGSASQRPEVGDTAGYESGKKYSGRIPEIKYLPVRAIERQEMDFRPEVMVVSEEVAAHMDYSQPVEVTAFRYGKANDDTLPVVTLQDGHHRTAAAIQTGREYLPVEVRAINAKGEKLAALIAMSRAIEARLGIDDRKLPGVDQEAMADQALTSSEAGRDERSETVTAWSLRPGDRIVTRTWPEGRLIQNTEPGLPQSTKIRVTYEGNGEFEDREVFGASDAVIVRRKVLEMSPEEERDLVRDLADYASRFADLNNEPEIHGQCRDAVLRAEHWLESGAAYQAFPRDLVADLVEYVQKYADLNDEPVDGHCRGALVLAERKLPEVDVPHAVRDHVTWALNRLREHEAALRGVQLSRGNGHILALELKDRQEKIKQATDALDEFRALARKNGVDAEAIIRSCGGVPDLEKFGYVAQPTGRLPEKQLTSRKLAEQYPVKGSMPHAVVHQLYQLREAEVAALSQRSVIVEADLGDLDRGGRAVVASLLYAKCDDRARQALLKDEHPHVRSCAAISRSDLAREPGHDPSPSSDM